MRLDVHRGELAAIVDFDVESDAVAFLEAGHASPLHRADVDEGIGLSVVTRDKAEAFGGVEELHRARGAFAGQLTPAAGTARCGTVAAEAAAVTAIVAARGAVLDRHRFAFDLQVDR